MKNRFLAIACVLAFGLSAFAQSTPTPNIGLLIPPTGSNNWYIPLNYNFNLIDQALSGNLIIPALNIAHNVSIGGTLTANNIAFTGGGSFAQTPGSTANFVPYFSSQYGLSGVGVNGFAWYSTGAIPRAATPLDLSNWLVANMTGCNVTANVYNPATNSCIPSSGGPGAVTSVFGRTSAVVAQAGDYNVSQVTGAAPLASPALTGEPTAPTPANTSNSTDISTTAFVHNYIAALTYLTPTGAITSGHCAEWASATTLQDAGGPCGTSTGITQLTGDVGTASGGGVQAATLATVNASPGTYGDSTHTATVVVNGKGLATSVTNTPIASTSVNGVSCAPGSSCSIPVSICAGTSGSCAVQQINPAANGNSTTLSSAITSTQTTIPVTSAAGFTSPLIVAIDFNNNAIEWVGCTGISSNTLTGCTRGFYTGTPGTGSVHSSGDKVSQVVLAYSTSSVTVPFYYILQNGAIGYNGCSNQTTGAVCFNNSVAFYNQLTVGGAGATNGTVQSTNGAGALAPDWTPNYVARNSNSSGGANCGWAEDEFVGGTAAWDLFDTNAYCNLTTNGVGPDVMGFAYNHTMPGAMYWDKNGNVTAKTFTPTGYNRPNITQVTGKSGFLNAGGSYQIFSVTGAGTITFEHVTLGVTGSDARNLVQNSMLDIQCDGNFIAVPFGMFFNAMDAPKPYNTDYQSVPVMGSAFTGNVDGAMVFNRRTWINFYSGCTITLVNASATATAHVFVDTTYRQGTPVPAKNASTPRWYWNAYANYLPAVGPNSSGSFNTPQVYLMPTSTFSGGGEVESISYYVDAANQSYLEAGPVTWADGAIATQSGGGEDWATCGYYCNLGAQSIILSRAGFIGGSFLQDPAGAGDTLMWRRFDTNTDDNVPFTSTLAVSSANGDSGVQTTPSIAMNGLTTFWTANPTTSVAQFSPAPGTYASTQSVALTAYPSGATVCYTTNGTTPVAAAGSCTTGTLYTAPVSVPVTTTINAATAKAGFNNGILASALYTITNTPVYVGTCAVPGVVTSTTTVSCSTAVTAGDFAFALCRGSATSATYTMSATGDTFTQLTGWGTGPTSQASYAFGLTAGTTTFTCTSSISTAFQGLQVLIYHPGPLTALDQYASNVEGSNTTWTSAGLTTTNPGLVIACGNPGFGTSGVTFTSGTINGVTANNRTVNASQSSMCEDATFGSTFTSGTATVTSSTAGPWDGIIASFH